MKLVSMKQSAADAKAERRDWSAPPEPTDGVEMRLEHHHLTKLGMTEPLEHGTPVTMEGTGHVTEWHTSPGPDGEPRHRATIVLTKAGAEAKKGDEDDPRGGLRKDLKDITDASEAKRANADAERETRAGARDRKVPEKTDG
jgi:hypothetical protein